MRTLSALSLLAVAGVSAARPPNIVSPMPMSAPAAPVADEVDDRLPFLLAPDNRMIVKVVVPGPTPLDFLVDTGAERSAVSSEVARKLKFASAGDVSIVSFGGHHKVPTVTIPELRISKMVKASFDAMTFADHRIGADGFLGIDALEDKRVEFDFVNERLTIRRAGSVGPFGDRRSVVVRVHERDGRLIFSKAAVNGIRTEALLDTGSSVTIANAALRDALKARGKLGPTVRVKILAITGEVITADYGIVKSVSLPGLAVHNMPIAFALVEPFHSLGIEDRPALLLGMDALRVFGGVEVDFRHKRVRFAARESPGGTSMQLLANDQ